ncbi:16S rRNA (adenine(1518)-N(6)/adenine(1519)-N(6))-dimethyltransferase RsmA [Mycoplasma enhydrae]|uniref:16S rRNA (adenine(1518)-N(6)/adenine(1519)-N(6))- dimethyltransferase RsmA n=1 Tax=Mycoplasma enhydrae TaxID=2499220 RepID=UPI00197C56DD|nr:16S rRNA (adenine(1518)-N(6)/adenine(1519)-N(6))-dimethyltransferase RsmA [Mycoplasma enhydrae]MBN4089326.1 ribosomal RNA small subunit methyltransferase A [Mycoplasma enhydrae]MCV3753645.1 16S rRNA (adenine(1518)-N(6)/adenine(1519)-N(6))-dimethyltransferase RsmA [Mycoplasma enhydrae]
MNIKPKKRFGQNFLVNKQIQQKIVDAAEVNNEEVIEIGPGLGALTNLMIPKVKSLCAYEVDNEIYEYWQNKEIPDNITFINEDFLKANLASETKKVVIGNIPYNITSLILFKLINELHFIKRATLMIQKEVAERLIAKPCTKEYGKLSVSIQTMADIHKIVTVKAQNFIPVPKVDSMVIRIDFKKNIPIIKDLESYLKFISICFQFKRKTLINNLINTFDKKDIQNILNNMSINLNSRPEELSVKQYIELFEKTKSTIKK